MNVFFFFFLIYLYIYLIPPRCTKDLRWPKVQRRENTASGIVCFIDVRKVF